MSKANLAITIKTVLIGPAVMQRPQHSLKLFEGDAFITIQPAHSYYSAHKDLPLPLLAALLQHLTKNRLVFFMQFAG
jgi:hypothetical protein